MSKIAIITGITGQDGSYLAEHLLGLDYTVIGLYRRSSTSNFGRLSPIIKNSNFILEESDITDPSSCSKIVSKYRPHELYNLAAQSHVGSSFSQPSTTFDINTNGVINLLESIKNHSNHTKFYQASTSEMFGSNYQESDSLGKYQNEKTQFVPQSPYAISKLASHHIIQIYYQAYNIFASSGILFNHESPRRGENFVTRKITKYIAKLSKGLIDENTKLHLGNLDATRDWGHAKDYVEGMHRIMQLDYPDTFVLATGRSHTVKDFLSIAFSLIGVKDYNKYVHIDPNLYRPCEVPYLKGDATKAFNVLGWQSKISFQELVSEMVYADINNCDI